jgi:parallel beta-helix repeat protein
MTINIADNNPRVSYSLAAGITQTSFAVPFEFFDETDVLVYIDSTLKTITTDYTVTGGDGSTGTITMSVTGPATVALVRDVTIERSTDFPTAGPFNVQSLNVELDKQIAIDADISDQIDRSVRSPIEEFTTMTLPNAATRADKLLKFDTAGNVAVESASALVSGAVVGANFTNNTFTGNGSQTAFTTTVEAGSKNNAQVYIDGVYQLKSSFSVSANTLTFTEAPPLNSQIEIIIGNAIANLDGDSGNVNYNQGGTGAQTRTVENKLQEFVSVKDFGAVGNGVADDTAAIQAAIDAVGSAGGGSVYVPVGTYKLTSSLTVTNDYVSIIGDGSSASILLGNNPVNWIIKFNANADYMKLDGLWIKGSAVDNTTTQYGVGYTSDTDDPENVIIQNCKFSHSNNGIVIGTGRYWKITQNSFETLVGIISGTGYGILAAANNSNNVFSENTFKGTLTSHLRHAIYNSVGSRFNVVSNNVIKDCNEGAITFNATSAQAGVLGVIASNNIIEGGGVAATNDSAAINLNGNIQDCIVSGNIIRDRSNAGIIATDAGEGGLCTNNTIKNNSVIDVAYNGLILMGTKNCTLSDNYVHNASNGNSGTYAAISVTSSGTFGTEVNDGSMVVANTVTGTNHRAAFQINAAAPISTNLYVANNVFRAGATTNRAVELNGSPNYVGNSSDNVYTYGTNDIIDFRSRIATLDFGSISANTTSELTVTITGVTTSGWSVLVSPTSALDAGIMWSAYVSAANTVTVRLANITGGAIDPASTDFVVDCYRHNV